MTKIVAYARTEKEQEAVEKFCNERNYLPVDSWFSENDQPALQLYSGETLVIPELVVLDTDSKWFSYATSALKMMEAGITIVTIKENLVLKKDIASMALVGMHALAAEIAKQSYNSEVTGSSTLDADKDERIDVGP